MDYSDSYGDANQLRAFIREEAYPLFDQWAREERLMTQKVAIVATGGVAGATNITVYFPPDLTTASNNFENKTGKTLNPNDKVYVLLKYGETDQGIVLF